MNKIAMLLIVMLMMPAGAMGISLPEQVVKETPGLQLAGKGRLRWLGLLIYDASLWARGANWDAGQDFALDIRYARDIKATRLIGTTVDEMRRLGVVDERKIAQWTEQMARVFPDVSKGQHLTGVNRAGIGADFYYQGKFAGAIADPEFARAFFAIWLDPRTREPGLRKSLIGKK